MQTQFPEVGAVTVTVRTSQTAMFPIALRIPTWSKDFTVTVADKKYVRSNDGYLTIDRMWQNGDKIKISFAMPVQVVSGGKSYPDQIAFTRGPQVLALDYSLNANAVQLHHQQFKMMDDKNTSMYLTKPWFGNQAYPVSIIDPDKMNATSKLILVPFAEAGQTGGNVNVWMPLQATSVKN